MNEAIEYQPTGIRGFGWGLLGYFGANLIINITSGIGIVVVETVMKMDLELVTVDVFAFITLASMVGLGFLFAVLFKRDCTYRATSTGARVGIVIQAIYCTLMFIDGFVGAL